MKAPSTLDFIYNFESKIRSVSWRQIRSSWDSCTVKTWRFEFNQGLFIQYNKTTCHMIRHDWKRWHVSRGSDPATAQGHRSQHLKGCDKRPIVTVRRLTSSVAVVSQGKVESATMLKISKCIFMPCSNCFRADPNRCLLWFSTVHTASLAKTFVLYLKHSPKVLPSSRIHFTWPKNSHNLYMMLFPTAV